MSRASPPLEFGILGPLEAAIGGRPVEIRGAKQRTLLALLLVHRGEAVPVATIIDELWPEAPPSTAQQSVQMHVSRLRRALVDAGDGDALRTSGAGYRIDVAADAAPEPAPARRRRAARTIGAVAVVVLAIAAVIALLAGALTGSPRGLPSIDPEAVGVVDPRTGRIERQLAFGGRPLGPRRAPPAGWVAGRRPGE